MQLSSKLARALASDATRSIGADRYYPPVILLARPRTDLNPHRRHRKVAMTRYSGTHALLAGVSCLALGSVACGIGSGTGDPVTASSGDESVLVASVLGKAQALAD